MSFEKEDLLPQLLTILDKSTEKLEPGEEIDVFYTDSGKPSIVTKLRLLSKLESCRVEKITINWIAAFLNTQRNCNGIGYLFILHSGIQTSITRLKFESDIVHNIYYY
jgi:hypothetical protein